MIDLTKIKNPFGLLDKETQEALKAHGGPYESFHAGGWYENYNPSWFNDMTYRVKPEPPKPREWWLYWNERNYQWTLATNKCFAEEHHQTDTRDIIHVREVLE